MIRRIRSLWRKILSRRAPPTEVNGKETAANPTVRRRVEVTVERETVSMLVRGRPPEGADRTAWEETWPEVPAKKLLPPAQSLVLEAVAPVPEDPDRNQK